MRKPNCQSRAPCHHRNFLCDTFNIFATHHRFRLLRFQHRLPNGNAFALAEREKFQRVIKTAAGTIFNHRNIIRNPDDRRFQVLENDIQKSLFGHIQDQVRLIHQDNATTPLTFPIGQQHRAQTSLQKGFLAHRFFTDAHRKQRNIQLLRNRLGKFRLARSFATIKKDVQWSAPLVRFQHLQNKRRLRIRLDNLFVGNAWFCRRFEIHNPRHIRKPVQIIAHIICQVQFLAFDSQIRIAERFFHLDQLELKKRTLLGTKFLKRCAIKPRQQGNPTKGSTLIRVKSFPLFHPNVF